MYIIAVVIKNKRRITAPDFINIKGTIPNVKLHIVWNKMHANKQAQIKPATDGIKVPILMIQSDEINRKIFEVDGINTINHKSHVKINVILI